MPWLEEASMSHPSMTYGSTGVPVPLVTPFAAVKPAFPTIVIVPCGVSARAGGEKVRNPDKSPEKRSAAMTTEERATPATGEPMGRMHLERCSPSARGPPGAESASVSRGRTAPKAIGGPPAPYASGAGPRPLRPHSRSSRARGSPSPPVPHLLLDGLGPVPVLLRYPAERAVDVLRLLEGLHPSRGAVPLREAADGDGAFLLDLPELLGVRSTSPPVITLHRGGEPFPRTKGVGLPMRLRELRGPGGLLMPSPA